MGEMWKASEGSRILEVSGISKVEDVWNPNLSVEMVNDRGDRQVLRLDPGDEWTPVYIKRWRFAPGSPYRWVPGKSDLRNRGRNEKENLELLSAGGIIVPKPIAFGELLGWWGPVASVLILEELTGYRPACDRLPLSPQLACRLISGVTETLGRLHCLDRYARSPGLKHFFVTENLDSFALIDVPRLDPARIGWVAGVKRNLGGDVPSRERDLSKLWVEWESYHADQDQWEEAFWEGYARHFPDLVSDPVWRSEVVALASQRLKRRRKRSG